MNMRCIFCKCVSDGCISVEHIIPESLGNKEHVLPKGWVCDSCNNYFAREVERPFLDSIYGKTSRFEMAVPNKKGHIPSVMGFHVQSRTKIELFRSPRDRTFSIAAADGQDEALWISSIKSRSRGTLYLPAAIAPAADITTARFIGKVALEILAKCYIDVPGANDEIVDKPELDELRRYIRLGQPKTVWPVHIRRIYPVDFVFTEAGYAPHQILHEWMIHIVPESEYYAIVAIFGIEYAINLGGPELDGYKKWLKVNDNQSPLFSAVG